VDIWSFLFPGEDKKKRRFIFEYLGDMFASGARDGSGSGGRGDDGYFRKPYDVI
jgi:hypothetical protein